MIELEKILIVDDQNDIAELISDILEDEGYVTTIKNNGTDAINAIKEMLRQCPNLTFDDNGIIQKGVIIRHLVLPNHTKNSIGVLRLIKEHFSDSVLLSLMGQYTPYAKAFDYPDINRKITPREYDKVLDELIALDLDGFAQELESADKSYIPQWDY